MGPTLCPEKTVTN